MNVHDFIYKDNNTTSMDYDFYLRNNAKSAPFGVFSQNYIYVFVYITNNNTTVFINTQELNLFNILKITLFVF